MTEPTTAPFVSIIIPVFNDVERLALCLAALEAQTYPADRYEVVVVDNGSAASPASATAGYPHTRYFVETRKGSYEARNRGLSEAKGEFIGFTDSDCIPSPDWIERGVDAIARTPNAGLIAGHIDVFFRDPARPTPTELFESLYAFPQPMYVAESRYGVTANVFTRRAVLDAVGAFDASLQSGGDREWGNRVDAAGYALVYAEDVRVAHPARHALPELLEKARRVITGDHAIKKNRGWRRRQFIRSIWKEFVPPVQRTLAIYRNPQLPGCRAKTSVAGVLLAVRYTRALQRLWLWLRDLT